MKTIEDLPVNEWNHHVSEPAPQTADYWQPVLPESWPQEMPAVIALQIGTDEQTKGL